MRKAVLVFLALVLAACAADTLRTAANDRQQREADERFQQQHRATLPDSF